MPPRGLITAVLAWLAASTGCGIALRPKPPFITTANPFIPAAVEIHALTRLDRTLDPEPVILCHVELRDGWGDPVKGAGVLEVQLYRPTGQHASGLGIQEMRWEADLRDLETNAALYDRATRTYRLPLNGLPEWVADTDDAPPDRRALLRAVFTMVGDRGDERVLAHEYVLSL